MKWTNEKTETCKGCWVWKCMTCRVLCFDFIPMQLCRQLNVNISVIKRNAIKNVGKLFFFQTKSSQTVQLAQIYLAKLFTDLFRWCVNELKFSRHGIHFYLHTLCFQLLILHNHVLWSQFLNESLVLRAVFTSITHTEQRPFSCHGVVEVRRTVREYARKGTRFPQCQLLLT